MSILKVNTIQKKDGTQFPLIGQVVQTHNTSSGNQDTTSTSASATAITGSITPTSTSSKVLVNFQFNFLQNDPQYTSQFYIYRGGSSIYQKSDYHSSDTSQQRRIMDLTFLDSPSSTSSVTYTLYTAVSSSSGFLRVLAGSGFDSANVILQEVLA